MSKKSCPCIYSDSLYKKGQDFLYIQNKVCLYLKVLLIQIMHTFFGHPEVALKKFLCEKPQVIKII